jgi:hypothetical protein
VTSAVAAYTFGNCTYYVATRFPNIYPYLGNAKDWIGNAKKQGYQVLSKPAPDTIVVYGPGNGYSALGHVAVVDSVNSNGTFNVSEMNYKGFDLIDNRVSTMAGVIGFIVPPGSSFRGGDAAKQTFAKVADCVVGGPNIFGQTICMDGVLGVAAIAAGGALIVAAIALFAAFALKKTEIASGISDLLPFAGGPVGAAVKVAETSKPKPKPNSTVPDKAAQDAAHNQRMTTAKARLPQSTYTGKEGKKYEINLEAGPDYGKRREVASHE